MENNSLQKKQLSFNKEIVGIAAGLIVPFLVMVVFAYYKNGLDGMKDYFTTLINYDVLTSLISLCAIPNLLIFFLFMWTDRLRSSRGVIIATLIYTFIVIIIQNT